MFPPPTAPSVPPTIKGGNLTSEVTALLGATVTLECEARGVPLPAVTWYRNGAAVLSSRQAQYVDRGHFLKIPLAQASDAGRYTCRVTSVAGSAERNYRLDVYRKNLPCPAGTQCSGLGSVFNKVSLVWGLSLTRCLWSGLCVFNKVSLVWALSLTRCLLKETNTTWREIERKIFPVDKCCSH